jgi:hypothetical protein
MTGGAATLHRAEQGVVDLGLQAQAAQDHHAVHPGVDRGHGSGRDIAALASGDGVHDQGVGEKQALEAQLLAQQVGHQPVRERRGQARGVDAGEAHMGRADGIDTRGDRRPERHQFDGLHAVPPGGHAR